LPVAQGECVFHGHRPDGCEIHRALGHAALPLACRQFPRVTVRDPRGASVTLSHYCPTAAGMLGAGRPVSIAQHPDGFPADGEYVGLDADEALPPRLRPDMLMDWESWWTWERLAVDTLASSRDAGEGLARLRGAVEHVRSWRPSEGPLAARVEGAFQAPPLFHATSAQSRQARIAEVAATISADLRPASLPDYRVGLPSEAVRLEFLIAHAFANWTAHLGPGLRTWLRSIEAADAMIAEGAGVGTADLWLRHLADPWSLAEVWAKAEEDPGPEGPGFHGS
jgi:hypothetical protein